MASDAGSTQTWEQVMLTVLGVDVPKRDGVSSASWIYLSTNGPRTQGDPLVFTATPQQTNPPTPGTNTPANTELYFDSKVEAPGSPFANLLTIPNTVIGPAISSGHYDKIAIDPRTFADVAAAFDQVNAWLGTTSNELAGKRSDIGPETFSGSAARAFSALIGNVVNALADLNAQMSTRQGKSFSDAMTEGGQAATSFLNDIWNAYQAWLGTLEHRPQDAVLSVVRELATTNQTTGNNEIHPTTKYGDMTTPEAWAAVENAAKQRWNLALQKLDASASTAATALGNGYQAVTDILTTLASPTTTDITPMLDTTTTSQTPDTNPTTNHSTDTGQPVTTGMGNPPPTGRQFGFNSGTANMTTGFGINNGPNLFTPTAISTPNVSGRMSAPTTAFSGTIGAPPPMVTPLFGGPFTLMSTSLPNQSSNTARVLDAGVPIGGAPVATRDGKAQRIRSGVADDLHLDDAPSGTIGRHEPPITEPAVAGGLKVPATGAQRTQLAVTSTGETVAAGMRPGADEVLYPMAPMCGGAPVGANGTGERERLAWAPADQENWGTDPRGPNTRIGRDVPDEEVDPEEEFIEPAGVDVIGRPGRSGKPKQGTTR